MLQNLSFFGICNPIRRNEVDDFDNLYTVIMYALDADLDNLRPRQQPPPQPKANSSSPPPSNFVHWLVVNVPVEGLPETTLPHSATTLLTYQPAFSFPYNASDNSIPRSSSAADRYALLAFRQSRRIRRRPRKEVCPPNVDDRIVVSLLAFPESLVALRLHPNEWRLNHNYLFSTLAMFH